MKVDRGEMLRYLNSAEERDERMLRRIDDAARLAESVASPRHVYRRLDVTGGTLAGYDPCSRDVAALLKGCGSAYLFAATIGSDVEKEEEKAFARGDSLGAVALDAAASCLIESYADEVCEKLAKEENVTLTARFSCGYGDYPLEHQSEVCRLLDTRRRIGLYVNEGGMLMPRKSITAVMGVLSESYSPTERANHTADKCSRCGAKNCAYRKAPQSYGESQ